MFSGSAIRFRWNVMFFAPRELTAQFSFARQQRGLKMLLRERAFTMQDLTEATFDTYVETADRVLPDLGRAANRFGSPLSKAAAKVLMKWNRFSERQSRGAALYFAFYDAWIQLTLAKRIETDPSFFFSGDFFGGADFFSHVWSPNLPLNTPSGIADPALAVQALEVAAQGFVAAGLPLDLPWGAIARLRGGSVDAPGLGGPDPTGVFAAISYGQAPDGALQGVSGETFIALVEFGRSLKAKVLLSYGNSSRPDSPHNGDQLALLSNKQMRDPWRTRSAVLQHLEATVVLP